MKRKKQHVKNNNAQEKVRKLENNENWKEHEK